MQSNLDQINELTEKLKQIMDSGLAESVYTRVAGPSFDSNKRKSMSKEAKRVNKWNSDQTKKEKAEPATKSEPLSRGLAEYMQAVEQHQYRPAVGDTVSFQINEELEITAEVTEVLDQGIVLNLDATALDILESLELAKLALDQGLTEAKYQGRTVQLGKPHRTPGGPKKFSVYVKNPKTGNVKKVNFGDPNMEIKRDNPKRRKNFRARHGCGTSRTSDRTKAGYWSCRMWSKKPVSKIT